MEFAINLFAGLIIFNIFAECASKGTQLITANPNYIKKVIFPIEVLGIAAAGSAFFQGTINLLILITVRIISGESVGPTILFIPILWWGYMQAVTSMCWILSIIGVIIKDVGQIIGSVVSIMMF